MLYQIIHKVREDYIEGTIQRDLWQNMYVNILHEDLVQVADKDHTADARKALRSLRHKDIEIEDEEGNWPTMRRCFPKLWQMKQLWRSGYLTSRKRK